MWLSAGADTSSVSASVGIAEADSSEEYTDSGALSGRRFSVIITAAADRISTAATVAAMYFLFMLRFSFSAGTDGAGDPMCSAEYCFIALMTS